MKRRFIVNYLKYLQMMRNLTNLANGLNFEFFKSEIKTELAWRKLIYGIYNNKINVKEEEITKEMEQIIKNQSTLKEYKIQKIEISFTTKMKTKKLLLLKII